MLLTFLYNKYMMFTSINLFVTMDGLFVLMYSVTRDGSKIFQWGLPIIKQNFPEAAWKLNQFHAKN